MRFRLRLSAVLMLVNLAVIALPLGSIFFFRIYENQLIQETERELISQAAVIGAAYQATFRFVGAGATAEQAEAQAPAPNRKQKTVVFWSPIAPQLDLARVETLASRPDGREPAEPPSALAAAAGKALSPVLKSAQRTTLVGVRVLDENGTTVGGTGEIGQNFGHVAEVRTALNGKYASALRFRELQNAPSQLSALSGISRGTKVRVFVAFPVIDGDRVLGAVYLSRTPKSVLRHLYDERHKALLALLTVLFLSVSLAVLTSRTISRPMRQLVNRTGRVARGEAQVMEPLERPGTREMAELSEGISSMATALVDRAAYIRTLANHVSHEFKTPLASIQGAVELLQDHDETMSRDERRKFLDNIEAGGLRLKALLDRLLELARAENAVRTEERVAVSPLVARVLGGLAQGVTGDADIADGLEAQITEEALSIVLSNLVDNAVQHKATRILVTGRRQEGRTVLEVHDDGEGIRPANSEKIFEHFFTTRREVGGTGLGLGIVDALLKAHQGRISLIENDAPGAAFRIELAP